MELQKQVVDTNILIDTPEVLTSNEHKYVIPYVVLMELDGLKKNPDLNFSARHAIKIIYEQIQEDNVEIVDIPSDLQTNDEKIVQSAKAHNCALLTEDIGARAVAKSRGVPVVDSGSGGIQKLDGYSGYEEVTLDISYESYVSHKELQVAEAELLFGITFKPNSYVIVTRITGKIDIWKEQAGRIVRVSQSMKPYKDAGIMITPIDAYQMVAWDAVFSDVPLTVLDGKMGSSKTLSALVGLLVRTVGQKRYQKFTKIYFTRPPIPVDRSLQLGFNKGSIEEKAQQWIAGITSNLKFLFGEVDANEILDTKFAFVSLESIQGLSLLPTEALLVDEWSLLSKDMLKQVLSRIGEGGKVVLAGDPVSQTYGANRGHEGFKVLHKYVGQSEYISYVKLDNIYRSKFVEFVDSMFEQN